MLITSNDPNKNPFVFNLTGNGLQANVYTYFIHNEITSISGYNGSDREIEIPNTIDGYSVTAIGNSAFRFQNVLTRVVIPKSVTSIGNAAFYQCYFLSEVIIPESITSIGNSAFEACYSLEN